MKKQRANRYTDDLPAVTVMESGNVERDARYIMTLRTKPQRQHELWRIGHLHGTEHEKKVERRVWELWKEQGAAELKAA